MPSSSLSSFVRQSNDSFSSSPGPNGIGTWLAWWTGTKGTEDSLFYPKSYTLFWVSHSLRMEIDGRKLQSAGGIIPNYGRNLSTPLIRDLCLGSGFHRAKGSTTLTIIFKLSIPIDTSAEYVRLGRNTYAYGSLWQTWNGASGPFMDSNFQDEMRKMAWERMKFGTQNGHVYG